jgi:hypothetical protein
MHNELQFYPVVIRVVDVSAHPEVTDFDDKRLADQTVARGQVTVHEVQRSQVPWENRFVANSIIRWTVLKNIIIN